MLPIRTAILILTVSLIGLNAEAQFKPKFSWFGHGWAHKHYLSPLSISRWTLSFNPLGLIEPPMAVGLGVGYRLSAQWELWSETSFLTNGVYTTDGPLTGIRQILQGKYFPGQQQHFFIAVEARYKSYQFRGKDDFINAAAHDTLRNYSNFSRHYFWGGGAQVGWRFNLGSGDHFQLETTVGLGFRSSSVIRQNVPRGYKYVSLVNPIDFNIPHSIDNGFGVAYLPGSVRLIYLFGKRLRP